MSQIKRIEGRAIPLVGNDIDTDRITPARFLRCVTFDGLAESVFTDDRDQEKGNHPFDQEKYQGASILVVNRNFGCGSSREHAPQAIKRWGIQAIVGESFAEIFAGNCIALGLPCLTLDAESLRALQELIAENPQQSYVVDLETREVQGGDKVFKVELDEKVRQQYLEGQWDSLSLLLASEAQIHECSEKLPY